jgi:preprotein translocase subunit Sss1
MTPRVADMALDTLQDLPDHEKLGAIELLARSLASDDLRCEATHRIAALIPAEPSPIVEEVTRSITEELRVKHREWKSFNAVPKPTADEYLRAARLALVPFALAGLVLLGMWMGRLW